MKNHKNIAVFIPHLGCKNACVFCSQTKITGVCRTEPDLENEIKRIRKTIEEALPTINGGEAEIAFFGGSFTGIGEERMIAFLKCANEFLGDGIKGIRLSTRPDYIDRHICDILKQYNVTAVELGIQSTSDEVLAASKRGHTVEDTKNACALIKGYGFELGGQMMVGMPLASAESECETARDIVKMGADTCRIYPMVVFEGTPLYDMTLRGEYTPLTNEEAAVRCGKCAEIFIEHNVEILRIGLHSSENLANAPFGANHPAMGELAEGEIYYSLISKLLENYQGEEAIIEIPKGEISKCLGHKGRNRERYKKKIKLVENGGLRKYDVRIRN